MPDLVLLSLLAERPQHGYQANLELERRQVRDWAGISRPQVYYSLEKLARAAVRQADVLVENYRPDVKFRLGIDYESVRSINKRIVGTREEVNARLFGANAQAVSALPPQPPDIRFRGD